jgi:eukaryotic-like serine/threonine-protein kinase
MGSRVAEQSGSSRTTNSAQDDPRSRVVIVPDKDRYVEPSDDSATISAEPPFLGEQHETIVSKQRPGSSNRLSLDAALADSTLNPAEMGTLLKGEMLGHFRMEEFVGGGGMGVVFRATDTRLGRIVAVKILTRDRTDADTLRRFQNEAQSAARLDHENIARVYYVGEDRGLHFIVFEFIEGTNIRDLVQKEGPLPVETAISYVLQVAEALEHASMRNVIHRDIKPSNVLVTATGRAKLVDMGLARLHQMESDTGDLTASGVTLGTFDYISPEQARDPRTADVRSDLYSLGCTFYFMLTGRPPFPEGTVLQKLLSHSTEEPTDPRMLRPDLDDQIVQTLQRLLAKQPAQRYQRASELIGHLLLVAERLNLGPIARNGAVWSEPRNSSLAMLQWALPWALPILLFIVLVLVLIGVWSSPEPFEFGAKEVQLRMAQTESPAEVSGLEDAKQDAGETAEAARRPAAEPQPELPVPKSSAGPDVSGVPIGSEPGSEAIVEAKDQLKPVAQPPSEQGDASKPDTTKPSEAVQDSSASGASTPEPKASIDSPAPTVEPPAALPSTVPSSTAPTALPPSTPPVDDGLPEGTVADPETSATTVPADPSETLTEEIAKIVVSDQPEAEGDNILSVSSLSVACREARRLGVKQIELHFDGPRDEAALDITSSELTISSGIGYQPLIVFRPRDEALSTDDGSAIDARGSRLVWQNVQILLDLSEAPSRGWSLFRLHSFVGLELQNSVLTIRNVDDQGRSLHRPVTFVSVEARPSEEPEDDRKPPISYYVNLTDTMLRGQASVVRAEQATAFRLYAQNSLIVTRNHFADVEGSRNRPSLRDGRIDIVLRHTTIASQMGLVRMTCNDQNPHQLDLFTDIADSILYITDDQAPVFHRMGISDVGTVENHLDLRGRDNFYPGSTILLRLGPAQNGEDFYDFDFDQRGQMPFVEEKSPHLMLIWRGLPGAGFSEERHMPAHYELEQSEFNPAFRLGEEPPVGASVLRLPTPLPLPAELGSDRSVP